MAAFARTPVLPEATPAGPLTAQLLRPRRDLLCPLHVCAVRRRRFPVGVSPTRQPLQREATGAVMEVTKWLKPSVSVSRIGDSASVQAVTRVNAEQALYGAFVVKRFQSGDPFFLAFLIGFFVRPGIPFLRPDPQYCKAGARRSCQGWPSRQPFHALCACQANLDSSEHGGTLDAVGMTIRGEPAFGRADQSRHNL